MPPSVPRVDSALDKDNGCRLPYDPDRQADVCCTFAWYDKPLRTIELTGRAGAFSFLQATTVSENASKTERACLLAIFIVDTSEDSPATNEK